MRPPSVVQQECCFSRKLRNDADRGNERTSDRRVVTWIMDHHPIAIQAAAEKLECRSPQIEAKAPIVEFAKALNDKFAVGIEVARPLLECQKIAVAVVEDLKDAEWCPGKLVKEVM